MARTRPTATVVAVTPTDDEDWLYRRGRYSDGVDSPRAQPDSDTRRAPDGGWDGQAPPTRLGTPTPVGDHRDPGARRDTARGVPPRTSAGRPMPGRPMAGRPTAERGGATRVPRRRRPVRRVVTLLIVLAVAYLVLVPAVMFALMPRVQATPSGARPADTPGHVFVLAGSDSREGLSTTEQDRLGTGSDAGRRTDTILLLYVPPGGRSTLVSVPRDSFVPIPGHGRNKINAAYSFGGPPLLVQTIEQHTGLRVDGYAEVGFGGFANVVDAVGGIEMCPERAIKDRDSNLDIPAGCQQMDGATALGYVRMRKADPQGDLGRAARQREMVGALAKRTLSPTTIALPWRWFGVNWALSRGITVGQDDGPGDMFGLANGAVRMATGQGDQIVVPVGNVDALTSAGSAVTWDARKSKAMFEAMARGEGDLRPYA